MRKGDMTGWKRASFDLTESEIRRAIECSYTAVEAAAFLRINIGTFKRYATMYYDKESGVSLYQLLLNNKKKIKKKRSPRVTLDSILEGKHPKYNLKNLQDRLISEGMLIEQCNICGFCERRITDYKVPLTLAFIDGDTTNHAIDNMELLCYNHFYLYYGELFHSKYRVDISLYKKDRNIT